MARFKQLRCQILDMASHKRPSFNEEWWEEQQEFLRNNPSEGFSEDEVKQWIKFVVNKYVADKREKDLDNLDEDTIEKLVDQLEEKMD